MATAQYIHVPPDLAGEFAALLTPATGAVLSTFAFPACERGDILPSGIYAVAAETAPGGGAIVDRLALYSPTATLITEVTSIATANWGNTNPVRGNLASIFYVAVEQAVGNPKVYTVSPAGVVGGTIWTLPAGTRTNLQGMAPSIDDTILYYTTFDRPAPIKRYDLVNAVGLSDLVAGDAVNQNTVGIDLYVLPSTDILVMYRPSRFSLAWEVRRYTAAGVLQKQYALGNATTGSDPFIALDPDPTYFWTRTFLSVGAVDSTFTRWNVLLGTFDIQYTVTNVEGGGQVPKSCPFFLLPQVQAAVPFAPPGVPGDCCIITPSTLTASPSRSSGCNTGGVGWLPTYAAASGVVPIGADPNDGEPLTGKRAVHLWAEVTHVLY